jgi:thiosulfate/3-mercaptopyruvate sulfurtransferase
VDAKAVRASIADPRVAVIDARDPRFYTGQAEGMHVREGHIPGAKNLPFNTLIDDNGAFKSRPALEKALDAAGATADKRVISYCHIGQQATVVYFAARLLGRDARLYDGSWDEWSRMSAMPIETGRR